MEGSTALLLDATHYFNNADLSDVTIVIREASDSEPTQLDEQAHNTTEQIEDQDSRCLRLPGHKIILSAYSALFRTKIARWSEDNELELVVPSGQLEVGQLLIQCMYQPQPQLSGCNQQQLLQLLQLADKHDVSRAAYAASSTLSSILPEQMQWETAIAVYNLPPGCADLESHKPVYGAAKSHIQHELGDLEVTWQDAAKQQLLLELPVRAFLELLCDDSTRVATENTVAYTIQAWAGYQQSQHQQQQGQAPEEADQAQTQAGPSQEQLQQLVEQIRMQHCTQLYICTVMPHMPAVARCFTTAEWLCACAKRSTGNVYCSCFAPTTRPGAGACDTCGFSVSAASEVGLMLEVGNSAAERHPAWRILTARPKSAIGQLTISWRLPMSDLAALIDRTIDSEGPPEIFTAPAVVWAGCRVQAWVCGLKGKAALGAWHAEPAAADAVCAFAARATMSVRDRPAEVVELHNYDGRLVVSSGTPSSFAEVFMIVLDVQSGIEAERRLNEQGVVQRDGCVHFKLQLTDPLM